MTDVASTRQHRRQHGDHGADASHATPPGTACSKGRSWWSPQPPAPASASPRPNAASREGATVVVSDAPRAPAGGDGRSAAELAGGNRPLALPL